MGDFLVETTTWAAETSRLGTLLCPSQAQHRKCPFCWQALNQESSQKGGDGWCVIEQTAEGHEWLRNTPGSSTQPFPTLIGQEGNSRLFSKMLTLMPSSLSPPTALSSLLRQMVRR